MSDVIQLGPFLIQTATLVYVLAALSGYGAMGYRLRRQYPAYRRQITDLAGSGAILGLLIWKLSYAVFYPWKVWENPASLLYFSGGDRGVWLALGGVALYAIYRMRKAELPFKAVFPALAIGVVISWGIGHVLYAAVWREDVLYHAAQAGLCLVLYLALTARTDRRRAVVAVLGIAGMVLWGYLDRELAPSVPHQPTAGASEAAVGLKKGNLAPDFALRSREGDLVRLSDFRGSKVILNMWATWCPPCRAEMPDMQEFYEKYKADGVTIVSVNLIETEESEEAVTRFLEEYGISFPVLLDDGKQVARLYQGISIPTSYVIDADGIVREKVIGALHMEMMEKLIAAIE
ncbi:prolipoprotein diacylglyceryl transferase family protein [Brevibacillus sp. TJ4]|uniref:prolipoprotein diacylglyceryl transferase family protein n=1 Tax=Brevibacillus sp. TJ4 TaxID=3234853 RepID=UPI0037D6A4E9